MKDIEQQRKYWREYEYKRDRREYLKNYMATHKPHDIGTLGRAIRHAAKNTGFCFSLEYFNNGTDFYVLRFWQKRGYPQVTQFFVSPAGFSENNHFLATFTKNDIAIVENILKNL